MTLALNPLSLRFRATRWLVLGAAATLVGCASMSEDQCRIAQWDRVGEQDGARGFDDQRLAQHASACAKAGIEPDARLWYQGWERGLGSYCTPQTGWNEGLAGSAYRGVCRSRDEFTFLQAYRMGSAIRQAEQNIQNAFNEQRRLEGQLSKATTEEERRELRDRIRVLDLELNRLRFVRDTLPRGFY